MRPVFIFDNERNTTMQRNARNARMMGEAFAQYGLSLNDLARACGVNEEWVYDARYRGSRSIAQVAYECTRPDPMYQESFPTTREWVNLARFARAVNGYMRVPFVTLNEHAMPTTREVQTRYEDGGDAENGPRLNTWLVVVDVLTGEEVE